MNPNGLNETDRREDSLFVVDRADAIMDRAAHNSTWVDMDETNMRQRRRATCWQQKGTVPYFGLVPTHDTGGVGFSIFISARRSNNSYSVQLLVIPRRL